MIYSDWTATNTGIFYQINRIQALPFANDILTIDNMDEGFLLENAHKEMFSSDTDRLVKSILALFFQEWQDLTTLYKSIETGTISETISTHNNNEKSNNQIALSDSGDMFTTAGNNIDATAETSIKTKNYQKYVDFVTSNYVYNVSKKQLRKYLFINVY